MQAKVLFGGDLIFQGGVGRTDLPGGDWEALEASIRMQVYTLPDETRILSGHGEESSVGDEKYKNPFIRA
jgi:glyoxylase-like metal-dependent hydrolase (beta-lactamase superfamily II)